MKDFGILFKTLRKKAALTQKELADKLGIESTNISKWEGEKSLPDISILSQIASVLNVSCEDLLHPTETLKKISQLSDDSTPLECDDMATVFDNASEAELSSVPTTITQKRKLFTPKRILLACIPIIVLVISICAYGYSQTNFRFIEARTNVETSYGPAYELVFYQPSKLPDEAYAKHADKLAESWRDGEYADCTEDVFIVSYYSSLMDVDIWNDVFFRCYYFNNPTE